MSAFRFAHGRTYFAKKCPCCGDPLIVTDEEGALYTQVFETQAEAENAGIAPADILEVGMVVIEQNAAPPTAPTHQ